MKDENVIKWAKENQDLMKLDENPFATEAGGSKPQQSDLFFLWARAKEVERISKLPIDEQKKVQRSQREHSKRMAS